jgi:predicted TIM-barrel fold metal-dependent hydrolase
VPMTDALGPSGKRLQLVDAHTHTSGSEYDGSPEDVVACFDGCGIDKAFMFAPLLRPQGWELQVEHLDNIRQNNDYIAHFCSQAPERLIAFAVLNPNPGIAGGDRRMAARLMEEEAERCYHELGIRGVKMVPDRWTAEDEEMVPLLEGIAGLGMYVVFHSGIFMDERSSSYCRPALYEGIHRIPGFHGHLAHLGWPWVDEELAVLMMESFHRKPDPEDPWQLKADFSFGAPPDWRVDSLLKALNSLPPDQLVYGSDCWWPIKPEEYLRQSLLPHLAAFEAAADQSRQGGGEGSEQRAQLRTNVFRENVLTHWDKATRGAPQELRRAAIAPQTSNTRRPRNIPSTHRQRQIHRS